MNYLAHAFLSGQDEEILVGNFIADHVRNRDLARYSEGIVRGITLHRMIDTFTDSHPAFRASKRVFYEGFEKHSGILVDIFFDHFLAADFSSHSDVPLREFSDRVYGIYEKYRPMLPVSSGRFLDYVVNNDIYTSYAGRDGIEIVLSHLSRRIRHGVELQKAMEQFARHESALRDHFQGFFKEIQLTIGKSAVV